jgi:hypothetical protein
VANKKITELTELTDVAAGDLLAIVDDPEGTPATKRVTVANLLGITPPQIPGCVLWLDASDASTINAGSPANNDPVSLWADKSGNGYDFEQATANRRPTYLVDVWNGYPGVDFDDAGPGQQFLAASGAGLDMFRGATGVTLFYVAPYDHRPDYGFEVHNAGDDEGYPVLQLYDGARPHVTYVRTSSDYVDAYGMFFTRPAGSPLCGVLSFDLVNRSFAVVTHLSNDFRFLHSGDPWGPMADETAVHIILGDSPFYSAFSHHRFLEIGWYNRGLNTTEVRLLYEYLGRKRGLM